MLTLTKDQRDTLHAAKKVRAEMRKASKRETPPAKPAQNRERDPGFLAYLRRQPCEAAHMGGCDGPMEAAHIRFSDAAHGARNPGMQRKAHDRHANPLCRFHHQHDQHRGAERFFWERLGKDAYTTAAGHYARYLSAKPTSQEAAQTPAPGDVAHQNPLQGPTHDR